MVEGGDYQNRLGRMNSFHVTVKADDGSPVSQPDAGFGLGGMSMLRPIPPNGSYAFRLFLPHWAQFQHPGRYSVAATRKLEFSLTGQWLPPGQLVGTEAPPVETSVEVLPLDPAAMGAIIDALGSAVLGGRDERWPDSATNRLASIQDERVIPWFAKVFATRDYGRKFAPLAALAKFNHIDAFAVLKAGMEAKGADFENASDRDQLASNIRHEAAVALSRSPYPAAKAFLLSRRHDSYYGVRLSILHVLGRMPAAEARPILEEMAHDTDARVSNEANRYLGLLPPGK